ncbi:M12 family metallo-peptidase [Neptunitalea lumnitzerae]|uniref:T9SS type A sorting domain-containing protein n=1 Tax=Neptunitalea lumnitzerae TaxID=2965509 RepID=A0ABQ5MG83_9FLAO|nr:M12 family metallo-peptidase [Neptunitalea sp. Y10]GLB48367.1 hypothetical protein Y10_07350 [Neptunitalea sp. Y10]
MKKTLFLVFFLFAGICSIHAQQEVAKKINLLKKSGANFPLFQVLNEDASVATDAATKAVTEAVYATMNSQDVTNVVNNAYETIQVEIPYIQETLTATLYKVDLFTDGFTLNTDKATDVAYTPGVYYRGIIEGETASVVSLNFFQGELNGVLSSERLGNIVVGELTGQNPDSAYIIYNDKDLVTGLDFECHTEDLDPREELPTDQGLKATETGTVNTTNCVTMYFELDNDLYLQNGSDVTATTNWMTSVFNNVQTLYNNDGITVSLNDLFIWTTTDPYTGTTSGENLNLFYQNRGFFNADVGQLIGIDAGGLGGLASTIDGLCTDSNRAYSDVSINYNTVPTYSWTVMVITHEFGHVLGSRHTHACVWNGNGTVIDGCGQTAGYQEGSCVTGPIPTNGGSLMSYCHLISGVGINFSNGFGFQPTAAIQGAIDGSSCLSTDCISTCINMVYDVQATNITDNSAVITWNSGNSVGQFEVAVSPYAALPMFVTYTTVTGNSYTATGLNSNSYYRIRIRPVCTSGITSTVKTDVFATNGDVCGGFVFTDTGGTVGDYGDDQTIVRTFTPNQSGKVATVEFTDFFLETDYDYLYVYNGPDTTYPLLTPNGLTGNIAPGIFTSTAPDGSLTFQLISDPYVTELGWVANVSCSDAMGIDANELVDFTYYPNPTSGIVNIDAALQINKVEVYNTTGQLLYAAEPGLTETTVNLSKFASGTYFFTIDVNGNQANFKVVKY